CRINSQLYPGKEIRDLNESEKQTISALTTMAGSLAGSLAGGDSAGALTGAQAAKNEVENNTLAIPVPPPPVPGMKPPGVDVGLDGKPNWSEQIAKEIQASMSGFGEAVKNPAAFGEWVLEGFGITKPLDPNSYASFPSKEQLAKDLNTSVEDFHKNIKNDIKSEFKQEMKKIGTSNPDVGVDKAGNIVLKNPKTGKTFNTNVPLNSFSR
ncbi:VENN motif pre-toxin domain-containing protein, partial [Chromobacterium vaccinii]|uniref:VENN motif pre-toxin domain-containing protein n=1 Tax=Chromobacterium vaccinii TaxID=1108595 RepID=UPI003C733034